MDAVSMTHIENLSEYVKLLESYPSSSYIFRGENALFDKRLAGAFRCKKNKRFMNSIDEYYSAVGHRLTDIEKNNFLAFAQHYGLSTNLLDVTTNPLNALFFACNDSKEKGYVYIYPKMFMDITEIVETFQTSSVFDLFVSGEERTIKVLHDRFREIFESTRSLMYFTGKSFIADGISHSNHLFCKVLCMARDMYHEKNTDKNIDNITYDELMANISGDGSILGADLKLGFYKAVDVERERFKKLFKAILEDDLMQDIKKDEPCDLCYYIYFLLYCLRVEISLGGERDYTKYGDLFPPMVYRPRITFERARGQSGYFIYIPYRQSYGMYTGYEIEMGNISHVQAVEVKNPTKILTELDNVGVNLGTIYGDFDSIAKYIKEKSINTD